MRYLILFTGLLLISASYSSAVAEPAKKKTEKEEASQTKKSEKTTGKNQTVKKKETVKVEKKQASVKPESGAEKEPAKEDDKQVKTAEKNEKVKSNEKKSAPEKKEKVTETPEKKKKAPKKPLESVQPVRIAKDKKKKDAVEKPVTTVAKTKKQEEGSCVERSAICAEVVDHEPKGAGNQFAKNAKKLFCFSHIKGKKVPQAIIHKWYFKDKLVSTIPLEIKSTNFRTFSKRPIEEKQTGKWKVEIVNKDDNNVMETLDFEVK